MKEVIMTITVCCKKKEEAKLENKILLNIFSITVQTNGYFNYRIFLYWTLTGLEKADSLNNSNTIQGAVIWTQITNHTCQQGDYSLIQEETYIPLCTINMINASVILRPESVRFHIPTPPFPGYVSVSFFFKINLFVCLFVYGCVGSSLLHAGFL